MKIAQRLHYKAWMDDESYERMSGFCKKYQGCIDEAALFTDYVHHGARSLLEIEEECKKLRQRIRDLRQLGIKSVGINVLTTIGHIDEGARDYGQPFTPIMGYRGDGSLACFCPCHSDFQEYIARKYALYAGTQPDFIWVDDDIKLFWNGVQFGCFCPSCMNRFNRKMGTSYTRETLTAAMEEPETSGLRAAWVDDVSSRIEELLKTVKDSVRGVSRGIELGFMTQHQGWSTFNGMDFDKWFMALGANKGRPGEGYYEDSIPDDVCIKALSTARQAAEYPDFVTDVQYEVENFPYFLYQKSEKIILDECTLAAAQGMNGILLNTLKIEPGAFWTEHEHLYDRILVYRSIWDRMQEFSAGFGNYGFYTAISRDYDRRRKLHHGESFFNTYYGYEDHDVTQAYELCKLGVPLTSGPVGSCGTILLGNLAEGFTDDELLGMLGGAVLMDVGALKVLEDRGLGGYAGVSLAGAEADSVYEHFNMSDPVNEGVCDEYRDVRPAFFGGEGSILNPLAQDVRALAWLESYKGVKMGITESIYENSLGGRICVLGYSPWKKILSLSRRIQMMNICRYLTGGMKAEILDTCKAAEFVRVSADGAKTLISIINMSLDDRTGTRIAVRGAKKARLLKARGEVEILNGCDTLDGESRIFQLPGASAYEVQVILTEQ